MNFTVVRRYLKPIILPLSILCGVLFHESIDKVAFLAPILIFVMLLITFCKIGIREIRVGKLQFAMLACQILGAFAIYELLLPVNRILAQGAFICVFCPTATAAPVVTGILGGSVARVTSFSLISNIGVAVTAPLFFRDMGTDADKSFFEGFSEIAWQVVPLIISPLIVALALEKLASPVHKVLKEHQAVSFYVWALSLFIVVGRAVSFILKEPSNLIWVMIVLGVLSLLICIVQFIIGRRIGAAAGDRVAFAQAFGQKNTILAIWMATTYLHPLSSVAPAAYIIWQNMIMSYQIFHKTRRDSRQAVS
jgi:BASS family bile acid:Na+ symporter